ncbi:MAG: hypothetical protein RJA81_2399 [Planctomycetota bacterium]
MDFSDEFQLASVEFLIWSLVRLAGIIGIVWGLLH